MPADRHLTTLTLRDLPRWPMTLRGVSAIWAVACAIIAWNVAAPSFPFGDLAWWRAGWGIAAAAHAAVALGWKQLRLVTLAAVAPPLIRAMALTWTILRLDFNAGQTWIKVALYLAFSSGVAMAYSNAAVLIRVDDAASRG